MRVSSWLRPLAARLCPSRIRRGRQRMRFRPNLEGPQDRTVLAILTVTTALDPMLDTTGDGVSLREAIQSINAGTDINADVSHSGMYGTNDTINFAIPANDPGHVYYLND